MGPEPIQETINTSASVGTNLVKLPRTRLRTRFAEFTSTLLDRDFAHFTMLHESYVLRFRMSKVIIAGEAKTTVRHSFSLSNLVPPQSRLWKRVYNWRRFGVRKGNYG